MILAASTTTSEKLEYGEAHAFKCGCWPISFVSGHYAKLAGVDVEMKGEGANRRHKGTKEQRQKIDSAVRGCSKTEFSSVSPSTSSPLPASLQRSQTHTEETAHAKRPKGQRNFGFTRIRCLGKPFARAVHTPGTSPLHSLARKSEDEQQQSGGLQATFFNSLFSFGTRAHEDREAQKAREASEEESEESAAEPENAPTAERAAEGGQTEEELPGRRLTRGKGRQQTKQKSREESQEKARDGSESKSGKNFGETSREKTRRNYAEKSEGKPDKMSRDKAEKTSEKTSAEKAAEKECGSRGEQKGAETNVETTEEKSEKTENRLQGDTSESTEPGERKRRKPWNYGRPWTEEIRLKIAARTRLAMQRLKSERAAAKTDDGEAISRTPSAAKRAPLSSAARLKLSERLRARWRDPEARLKLLQLGRERTQSEATRAAIAESVRRKWREDPGYAERVREGHAKVNAAGEKRKKISETLKRLWRDEAFRHRMRTTRRPYTEERRRALSAKITAMWAERTDYRSRTVDAIRSRFDRLKVESFTRRLGAGKIPTQRVFSHFAANTPAGGPHAPDLFSILGVKQVSEEEAQFSFRRLGNATHGENADAPHDCRLRLSNQKFVGEEPQRDRCILLREATLAGGERRAVFGETCAFPVETMRPDVGLGRRQASVRR
ncbi:hypothetical protein TGRH88_011520 [Toxoplasma gondii]|uniref:Uncharacterized protein n=1 Tax=Toxoplasma gondii TaxID=5811 RepID=A0A7J6KB07_TOXGO|nr:hypothetical protein TGRH88_011520 [Toxoplasma gondii]